MHIYNFFLALSPHCCLLISPALVLPILFIALIMYLPPFAYAYRKKRRRRRRRSNKKQEQQSENLSEQSLAIVL